MEPLPYTNTPTRVIMPIFGVDTSFLADVTGWSENVQKYEMVEFLSGKLTLYVYNNYVESLSLDGYIGRREEPVMIGYYPFRNAIGYNGVAVAESPPPLALTQPQMWSQSAEYPGYSIKIVNSTSTAKNIKKLTWKMSQRNFKTMKADPSNFQINTASIGTTGAIPSNNSGVVIDFCNFQTPNGTGVSSRPISTAYLLWSLSFKVRFKQKVVVNPK